MWRVDYSKESNKRNLNYYNRKNVKDGRKADYLSQ